MFGDPNVLDGPDLRRSKKSTRFLRLGRAATGRVRVVAYTVRRRGDGESVRIVERASGEPQGAGGLRGDVAGLTSPTSRRFPPHKLRVMRRGGRPPLGAAARRLIAIRIDPQVLDAVRREARRRGLGYQSLINDLLAKHVGRLRSA